jgi:hypothetical protein
MPPALAMMPGRMCASIIAPPWDIMAGNVEFGDVGLSQRRQQRWGTESACENSFWKGAIGSDELTAQAKLQRAF